MCSRQCVGSCVDGARCRNRQRGSHWCWRHVGQSLVPTSVATERIWNEKLEEFSERRKMRVLFNAMRLITPALLRLAERVRAASKAVLSIQRSVRRWLTDVRSRAKITNAKIYSWRVGRVFAELVAMIYAPKGRMYTRGLRRFVASARRQKNDTCLAIQASQQPTCHTSN